MPTISSSSTAAAGGGGGVISSYQGGAALLPQRSSLRSNRRSSANLDQMVKQSSDPNDFRKFSHDSEHSSFSAGFPFYRNQDMVKVFGRVWNEIIKQLRLTDHINNEEKKNLRFFVCPNVPFNIDDETKTESIFNPLYISAGLFESAVHQYTQFVNTELFGWVNMSADDRKAVILHLDKKDWDRKQLLERAFTENLDKNGDIPVTFIIKEVRRGVLGYIFSFYFLFFYDLLCCAFRLDI
jgi:hypothetical protein